jgi:serine/threonine protein kinase
MSPEICLGEEFDHRTDIYSLGALFFEMLTGVPPFKGATPIETMRRQVSETPEIPEELRKRIPPKIRALIFKMLDKNPEKRHPNIQSLLRDIDGLKENNGEQTLALGAAGPSPSPAAEVKDLRDFISQVDGRRSKWPSDCFQPASSFAGIDCGILALIAALIQKDSARAA